MEPRTFIGSGSPKKMNWNLLIATERSEVNEKALDFYSFGHLIFGYISYALSVIVCLFLLPKAKMREFALVSAIVIGFVWELLENTVFVHKVSVKFDCRKDSVVNSQMDVLLDTIGAIISMALSYDVFGYLLGSVIFIGIMVTLFDTTMKLTLKNEE